MVGNPPFDLFCGAGGFLMGPWEVEVTYTNGETKAWHIDRLINVMLIDDRYIVLCQNGSLGEIDGNALDLIIQEWPDLVEQDCMEHRRIKKNFLRWLARR